MEGAHGVGCLEVKDGVLSLQAALTCSDPELEAPIQNHYSWSRCKFQQIHMSRSESRRDEQFISSLFRTLEWWKRYLRVYSLPHYSAGFHLLYATLCIS